MRGPAESWPGVLPAPVLVRAAEASARGGDEDLVARAQQGERLALQELFRRHAPAVYRRLTQLLGPDPDREDLVQQIFDEVFRGLGKFRGEARFSTFLYRVATNKACDHLKRRARRDAPCPSDLLEAQAAADPSPEELAARRAELCRAWRFLDRIKPKKRVAFLLRVVAGLSLEEIALEVGARPAAVAQRILHAQRELVALMQREERSRG